MMLLIVMYRTAQIETLAKTPISQGTLNLIAGLADESEVRCYKISRRIKG